MSDKSYVVYLYENLMSSLGKLRDDFCGHRGVELIPFSVSEKLPGVPQCTRRDGGQGTR